ncbi:hypothetical protein [Methyloprofundus sp.]|uniref:hypothetical protein n=1 Tax=Methyloprofundus sp. TaxID=2020875 RepID=UPI003D0E2256
MFNPPYQHLYNMMPILYLQLCVAFIACLLPIYSKSQKDLNSSLNFASYLSFAIIVFYALVNYSLIQFIPDSWTKFFDVFMPTFSFCVLWVYVKKNS